MLPMLFTILAATLTTQVSWGIAAKIARNTLKTKRIRRAIAKARLILSAVETLLDAMGSKKPMVLIAWTGGIPTHKEG